MAPIFLPLADTLGLGLRLLAGLGLACLVVFPFAGALAVAFLLAGLWLRAQHWDAGD